MRRSVALAVVLVVLLAGCTAGLDGTPLSEAVESDAPAPGSDGEATPDSSDGDSVTATSEPNPWGSEPVVVAVDPIEGRDVVPLVEAATAYWEDHAGRYAGYEIDYEVDPDAANPDIVVRFPDRIPECSDSHDAAGCAPYITSAAGIDRPAVVEVKAGLSNASTVSVLKHEFGHTLGLGHDDPPQDVMAESAILTTLPQPNATDRVFPWRDGEFTVYIDVDGAEDPAAARAQVRHALDYYERGAPGMLSNLTFQVVDDPEAEIVVQYVDASPCTVDSGSCSSTRGIDPDGDDAIELYTSLNITLVGLDTPAIGWHVGYWLAAGLGAEADAEKPPPFRNVSHEERRSEWWRDGS